MHVNYLSYNKAMYFFGFVRNLDNFVTGFVMSFYADALIPNKNRRFGQVSGDFEPEISSESDSF